MSVATFWVFNGLIFFYFFPTLTAFATRNARVLDYFVFNILIGWTLFGWFVLTTLAFNEKK